MRRLALGGAVLVLVIVVGTLAVRSMSSSQSSTGADGQAGARACRPQPCASPHEFELHLTRAPAQPGDQRLLRLQASFQNAHYDTLSMNGDQRRADLLDFQLRDGRGVQSAPVFDAPGCEHWNPRAMGYQQGFGPRPICFRLTGPPPLQLIWSPDLGLLFDDTQVALPDSWAR